MHQGSMVLVELGWLFNQLDVVCGMTLHVMTEMPNHNRDTHEFERAFGHRAPRPETSSRNEPMLRPRP